MMELPTLSYLPRVIPASAGMTKRRISMLTHPLQQIIFIILLFLPLTTYHLPLLYAQEDTVFKYEPGVNRDPFIPLVTKDGKLTVAYGTLNSINDVILEGILYDAAGKSVVIMNDMVLKEGAKIGSIEVKKIEKNYVILSSAGKDHTFKLDASRG